MSGGVRQSGAWARKPVASGDPEQGRHVARRSALLAAAGIHTPIGDYDESAGEVVFPWIPGRPGRELLRRGLTPEAAGRRERGALACLATLLKPVAGLHGADPKGLHLEPLDPWRRIHPRLRVGTPDGRGDVMRARAWEVYRVLRHTEAQTDARRARAHRVPVHGDYHVGQPLLGTPPAEPWVLDLDDLALGPPESDLGNVIAHLVTSHDLATGSTLEGFMQLDAPVRDQYSAVGGVSIDPGLVRFYGAVALLRRALKRRERAPGWHDAAPVLSAARSLAAELVRGDEFSAASSNVASVNGRSTVRHSGSGWAMEVT